jgi:hypothetical protein
MRGRLQAKLGDRAALSSHARAVELCRELTAGNPANVELRVYLALALIEQADSAALLAPQRDAQSAQGQLAERSYDEAVQILSTLAASGSISGTDLDTLAKARASLEKLRADRS